MDECIERFLRCPIEREAEWQGGVFDFGELGGYAFADSPMAEAKMELWVCCERELIHANPVMDETPWDLLVSGLLDFVETQNLGYRHARI